LLPLRLVARLCRTRLRGDRTCSHSRPGLHRRSKGESAPSRSNQAIALCAALDQLGVDKAHAVIGASYGGMIALALGQHDRARRAAGGDSADARPHPAATRSASSSAGSSRSAWPAAIRRGAVDRARLAMLSYRTREEFAERFEGGISARPCSPVRSRRLSAQPGRSLRLRMTPQRFSVSPPRSIATVIDPARIESGPADRADSDQLVPPVQMQALADASPAPSSSISSRRFTGTTCSQGCDKVSFLVGLL